MGTMKPGAFARVVKVTPGAVTQLLDGTTKSLRADTVILMEEATGYRASWIVTGKGPKKVADGLRSEDRLLLTQFRHVLLNLKTIPEPKRVGLLQAIQLAADETREAAAHIANLDKEATEDEDLREDPTPAEEAATADLTASAAKQRREKKRKLVG